MFLKNKLFTAFYTIFLIFNFNQSNAMTAMTKKPNLTFERHNFGVACYNASDLEVIYANMKDASCKGKIRDRVPYDEKRIKANTTGLIAFSGPVDVKWKSKDGEQHQYQLDLDEIFKGRQVLHQEKIEDIRIEEGYSYIPGIYVEVDDRTLNVYMDVRMRFASHVVLINKHGRQNYGRRNVTLAFTKTF
ncbi:MAG: hypothetical protein V4612_06810 [Pseudomonadota bacterium]